MSSFSMEQINSIKNPKRHFEKVIGEDGATGIAVAIELIRSVHTITPRSMIH